MESAGPLEDVVGLAEYNGSRTTTSTDAYRLVGVDDADGGSDRTHLLASPLQPSGDPEPIAYNRVAVEAAAARVALAGNLQSPVVLRGALEQGLLEVQRQAQSAAIGDAGSVALLGLALSRDSYAIARTADAMAYIVGVETTERLFTPAASGLAAFAGGYPSPTGPVAVRSVGGVELRRGQIDPADRIVLLAGPGWAAIEPHRIGAVVRGADPVRAAAALAQLAQDRDEGPVAIAVIEPYLADAAAPGSSANGTEPSPGRPATELAGAERSAVVGGPTTATDADVVHADGAAPRPDRPRPVGRAEGSATPDTPTRVVYAGDRATRAAISEPVMPGSRLNVRRASALLAALLIGALVGAVLGDQMGRSAAPPPDPIYDRYVELVAQLYAAGEDPGLVQTRLTALGPAGEPDALRRLSLAYSRSNDPAQRNLSKAIADLADLAARGQVAVRQPPAAYTPPAISTPSPQAGAPAQTSPRPAATIPPAVAGTRPTPVGTQPTISTPEPTPAPTEEPASTPATRLARVRPGLTESVNMRIAPQRTAGLVRQVPPGTQVEILERVEGDAVDRGNPVWYRVRIGAVEGFIYSSFIAG